MEILIAYILIIITSILYMMHEHIKFNYAGSVFEKMDNKLQRPWWKNNSRPELKKFKWLPMIWDGYHFLGWVLQLGWYLMFAVAVYTKIGGMKGVIIVGLSMAFFSYVFHQVSYKWFFKD